MGNSASVSSTQWYLAPTRRQAQWLDELQQRLGISRAELLRRLLDEAIDREEGE